MTLMSLREASYTINFWVSWGLMHAQHCQHAGWLSGHLLEIPLPISGSSPTKLSVMILALGPVKKLVAWRTLHSSPRTCCWLLQGHASIRKGQNLFECIQAAMAKSVLLMAKVPRVEENLERHKVFLFLISQMSTAIPRWKHRFSSDHRS